MKMVVYTYARYTDGGYGDILVVTPYADQRRLIQNVLNNQEIEVMTVKVAEKREKELVIYSGGKNRTNFGQLGLTSQSIFCDPRNVCVGMTRAKCNLVLFLETMILSNVSEYWLKLFQFMNLKDY